MKSSDPGMIMELKWDKDLNDEELDALFAEALDQINDKGYDTEMCEERIVYEKNRIGRWNWT